MCVSICVCVLVCVSACMSLFVYTSTVYGIHIHTLNAHVHQICMPYVQAERNTHKKEREKSTFTNEKQAHNISLAYPLSREWVNLMFYSSSHYDNRRTPLWLTDELWLTFWPGALSVSTLAMIKVFGARTCSGTRPPVFLSLLVFFPWGETLSFFKLIY